MGLAAWWLVIGGAALWRRSVWREAGEGIGALAGRWGVAVRPTWTGYEVRSGERRVRWRGGLDGAVTVIRQGQRKLRVAGWLDLDAVDSQLSRDAQT